MIDIAYCGKGICDLIFKVLAMNSKASLILGMATTVLTLIMIIMFASPLSATTNMRGNSMMMNTTPSSSSLQQSGGIPA
jgi:hypothetical protein